MPDAERDALAARPVERSGTAAFAPRHRADDRLDLREVLFGNLEVLGQRVREARDHLHDVGHRSDLAHLAHLVEKVVEREALLEDLLLELLRLLFRVDALRFLDQREHVAHAEDARGQTIGIERLERRELLADADELDRRAGFGMNRERRAAARVAVHLREDHARDPETIVEAFGDVGRLLAGHRVGDEQNLFGLDGRFDRARARPSASSSICSRPAVSMMTVESPRRRASATPSRAIFDRIARAAFEDRQVDLLAERLQLLDRGRTIDVGGDEQRLRRPCSFKRSASLPACVVLPEPCRPTSMMTDGGASENCSRASAPPSKRDQLVVDDLDDRLRRASATRERSAPTACSLTRATNVFGDAELDVGLEQRDAHFAQRLVDVALAEPAAAAQPREDRAQSAR